MSLHQNKFIKQIIETTLMFAQYSINLPKILSKIIDLNEFDTIEEIKTTLSTVHNVENNSADFLEIPAEVLKKKIILSMFSLEDFKNRLNSINRVVKQNDANIKRIEANNEAFIEYFNNQ